MWVMAKDVRADDLKIFSAISDYIYKPPLTGRLIPVI